MHAAIKISNAVSDRLLLWPLFIEFWRISVSRLPLSCRFMRLWFCLYCYMQQKIGLFLEQTWKRRGFPHEMSASDTRLGIRWFDFVSNVDVQTRTGQTPLVEILAARRIQFLDTLPSLRVMFQRTWRSAVTSICRLVVLLVPTGDDALVDPVLDRYTRFDGTRAVHKSAVAMLLERRNGPRQLRDIDDDDDDDDTSYFQFVFDCGYGHILYSLRNKARYWSNISNFFHTTFYITTPPPCWKQLRIFRAVVFIRTELVPGLSGGLNRFCKNPAKFCKNSSVYSQLKRVTDRRTDRQTDGKEISIADSKALIFLLHSDALKKTTAVNVINLRLSSSVDYTWRSHCWQHAKVVKIRQNSNKNLAIANRSRVSCAYNTSRASIITPCPWP